MQNKKGEVYFHDRRGGLDERIGISEDEARSQWVAYLNREMISRAHAHEAFLSILSHYLDKCDSLLEVGCGVGCFDFFVRRRFRGEIFGLDISRTELYAAGNFKKARKIDISFILSDAENLCFRTNTFDMAVMLDTLHHFPDLKVPLLSIRRVLKKGGHIFAVEPNIWSPYWKTIGFGQQPMESPNERGLSPSQLRKAIKDSGFKVVKIRSFRFVPDHCVDRIVSAIPIINLFGSKMFCVAEKL